MSTEAPSQTKPRGKTTDGRVSHGRNSNRARTTGVLRDILSHTDSARVLHLFLPRGMARSLQSMELKGLDEILAHLDRKFAKKSLNVCLGIDGSRVTEKATRTLLSLMSSMKEGSRPVKPQMTCVHVYDPAKPTPRHLAPEKVVEGAKAIIDSSLGEQNSVKYMSCCTDRSDGVRSTVMRISDECDTDLLVLGGAGVNERGMYVWFCTHSVSH